MNLRYFVADGKGRLRKVSRAAVRGLWQGRLRADALGSPAGAELRLVSVVCDAALLPQRLYLLRLPLDEGRFTGESYLALRAFARPDCVTPAELVRHHTGGWPPDFHQQMAVALDVPVSRLDVPLGVGGPLLLAAALRVSPRRALRYLH